MHNIIFFLIIIIPLAGYLTERYLEYLNSTMWSPSVPEKLKGICDEEAYRKSQLYHRENKALSLWSSTLNTVIIITMITTGGFALADSLVRGISSNAVIISLLFFGIIGFISDIINIPFSWYD